MSFCFKGLPVVWPGPGEQSGDVDPGLMGQLQLQ